ncbi:MAG: glycosyltransferase family 9 protein [Phycisphaerae bacterium]|nr:glycosyltransferase family 9 protein [Phycisphaerae bacterium]
MPCEKPSKTGVILHSGAIGDCLLTLPLAAFIKKIYALHRLDFIGPSEYINFYPGRTCIDTVISMDGLDLHRLFEEPRSFELSDNDRLASTFSRYEQVVSFLGFDHPAFEKNLLFTVHSTHSAEVTLIPAKPGSNKAIHVSDYYLDFFNQEQQLEAAFEPELTTVSPLPDDYLAGSHLLEQIHVDSEQPVVVIAPGSGSRKKCWYWENFFQTASDLKSNGVQPVFLLGPAEQERFEDAALQTIRQFPVLENLSLTQVLQVLTQADVFLGNDSGIGHLAAGMGKKAVILFGPTNLVQYAPRGKNVVIQHLPQENFNHFVSKSQAGIVKTLLAML